METPEHLPPGHLFEVLDAPLEIAELVAATAQLSRTSKGALSARRGYAAIRIRAMKLLKVQLQQLRADRSTVEHAIHTLVTRQACAERTPPAAGPAKEALRKSPRLSVYWRSGKAHDNRAR
jgi:hypothetical protein